MANPRISVCVPVHNMQDGGYFLKRLTDSLATQSFQDFELIVTEQGGMARNTNAAIKRATGDIIKILYMDDFLYHVDALWRVSEAFKGHIGWMASGCVHTEDGKTFFDAHTASYSPNNLPGVNTIGSPSVVSFENDDPILFDENLSWLLDVELYKKLYARYGAPKIIPNFDVGIGVGPHQMTNILTAQQKQKEHDYLTKKYV